MEELEDLSQGSLSPNGQMSGIPYSNIIQYMSIMVSCDVTDDVGWSARLFTGGESFMVMIKLSSSSPLYSSSVVAP